MSAEKKPGFQDFYENAPDMFVSVDAETAAILMCNRTLAETLGYKKHEIIGRPVFDMYHPDCMEEVRKVFQQFVKEGVVHNTELQLKRKDGNKLDVLVNVSAVRDEQGKLLYSRSVWRDISGRKKIEKALRESEHRFSMALRASKAGAWEWNRRTNEAIWSDENYMVLGLAPGSCPSRYEEWIKRVHPDDREEAEAQVRRAVEKKADLDIEFRVIWPDGSVHWINDVGKMMFDEDGGPIGMYGIQIDITRRKVAELEHKKAEEERQRLQLQLMQSQKLESVGRLSGGIAHDFNNLLSSILGYSELALLDLPETHPVRESLNVIRDSGEKATALTRQLLAFSRKQVLEVKVVNLNSIVEHVSKMLTRMIGEDVSFKLNVASLARNVMVDSGQIEQVLMNLAVNARDAMPSGGSLVVETADVMLDEEYARHHEGVEPGYYVMLSVTDTGVGMSREVRERIFEPFYTTKKVGKGTGLGLSMVYGIVKQHKGYLSVYSEEGKGTTFKIYLPATEEEAEEVFREDRRAMSRGEETILIVDDEPSLRDLVVDTLQPLGYKVIGAGSGTEALRICEKFDQIIDLLLTDVIMPGMSGKELADVFQEMRPEAKIVFMSGYSDEHLAGLDVFKKGPAFIQKPVIPSVLAEKLREILDR